MNKRTLQEVMRHLGKKRSPKKTESCRKNARIEWRPVRGFVGVYCVNNRGQVLRLSKQKVVGSIDKKGYHRVNLRFCGKRSMRPVHQLVMEAFVGTMPKGYEVNHKDGNKDNNRLSNLEYVTHFDNLKHAHKNNLINSKRNRYNAHLTLEQVQSIRDTFLQSRETHREIARRFGVTRCCISKIIRNETWTTPQKKGKQPWLRTKNFRHSSASSPEITK